MVVVVGQPQSGNVAPLVLTPAWVSDGGRARGACSWSLPVHMRRRPRPVAEPHLLPRCTSPTSTARHIKHQCYCVFVPSLFRAHQIPATVEFVDIAGLVKGASKGEGMGNQFLTNIRNTDAICQVRRARVLTTVCVSKRPRARAWATKASPTSATRTPSARCAFFVCINNLVCQQTCKREGMGILSAGSGTDAIWQVREGTEARARRCWRLCVSTRDTEGPMHDRDGTLGTEVLPERHL